jgi:hypothetical protein
MSHKINRFYLAARNLFIFGSGLYLTIRYMRTISYTLVVLAICRLGFAQDTLSHTRKVKNAISSNFGGILAQFRANNPYHIDIMYERALMSKMSVCVTMETGLYFYSSHTIINVNRTSKLEEMQQSGYSIMPELRFYPFTTKFPAPRGFFLGAFARYYVITESYVSKTESIENHGSALGGGINLGYKFSMNQAFFEPLIGYGFGSAQGIGKDVRIPNDMQNDQVWPLFLRAELRLGFCF